jgi:hypothetical protein
MSDPEPVVRMRAADALEKLTRDRADLLIPHKRTLLALAGRARQQEVRWHLAQMLPRLLLTRSERLRGAVLLRDYLRDESVIVRTMAIQALADLAGRTPELRGEVRRLLARAARLGAPAVRARARRLDKVLNDS